MQRIIALAFFIGFAYAGSSAPTGCFRYNGGFFYTAETDIMSCAQVCSTHGGFDATATKHTGNAVGMHFWPAKTTSSNWMAIECSSTDNNMNWGANGAEPDANWSFQFCHVNCACFAPVDDCTGDICTNVAEGGYCNYYANGVSTAGQCLSSACVPPNGTPCDDGNECTTDDAFTNGVCAGTNAPNTTPCSSTEQCSQCQAGVCTIVTGLSCDDGDDSNCDDMCSSSGVCLGTSCSMPVAPVSAPSSAPVNSPVNAPVNAPVNSPVNAPVNSPVNAPVNAPVNSPVNAPVNSPVNAPVNAPVSVPTSAPRSTPEAQISSGSNLASISAIALVVILV